MPSTGSEIIQIMNFDPHSVLHKIRSREKQRKAGISESPVKLPTPSPPAVSDYRNDRNRDEATTNSTLHIMAEQVRYMQDHIRRLENQLSTAHIEISRLRTEKEEADKATHVAVSALKENTQPLKRKRSTTPVGADKKDKPTVTVTRAPLAEMGEFNHISTNSAQKAAGYMGIYSSQQSREGAVMHHNFSSRGGVGLSPANYSSKGDTKLPSMSDAPELRLDILEKILDLDSKMAVPHVQIVF